MDPSNPSKEWQPPPGTAHKKWTELTRHERAYRWQLHRKVHPTIEEEKEMSKQRWHLFQHREFLALVNQGRIGPVVEVTDDYVCHTYCTHCDGTGYIYRDNGTNNPACDECGGDGDGTSEEEHHIAKFEWLDKAREWCTYCWKFIEHEEPEATMLAIPPTALSVVLDIDQEEE